jgi:hypothetical protein
MLLSKNHQTTQIIPTKNNYQYILTTLFSKKHPQHKNFKKNDNQCPTIFGNSWSMKF